MAYNVRAYAKCECNKMLARLPDAAKRRRGSATPREHLGEAVAEPFMENGVKSNSLADLVGRGGWMIEQRIF